MFRSLLARISQFDWILMASMFLLFSLGIAIIYSVGLGKEPQTLFYFNKQLTTFGVGLFFIAGIGLANYRRIKNYSGFIYAGICLLLVAVLFLGETVRGTKGWFYLGSFGFQPSELAKIGLVLVLAQYFSSYTRQIHQLRHLIVSGLIATVSIVLVMLQPDFGSAVILFFIWLGIILMSGVPKRYIISLGVLFAMLMACAWFFLFQPYQKDRILVFLHPNQQHEGSGYNVNQSLIAIGSGEIMGRGLGFGSQSHLKFLPENQTDFIFAVIAEEFGFLGVMAVLVLWGIFFQRLTSLMRRARDDFALFTALGIALIFLIQVTINVGGNLDIMPITGIVLPFMSYGGSALFSAMLMVGLAQSLASHTSS